MSRAHGGPDGFAVVDKPAGWTSHDVVAKARGLLGTRKVGHAGTLDPDVTGVLLLGVGRGTRLLRFMTALGKRYEGTFVLGVETTTLDASGEVVATHDQSHVTLEDLQRIAAERFIGPIMQIPPMVSAVKVGGRRLHELARAGIEVEREARPVTIHELVISAVEGSPGTFGLDVSCSSGTYVRTLVADLGTSLGGGAHLATLRRTAVGAFGVDEAVPLASLTPESVLPLSSITRMMPSVTVDDERKIEVGHGKRLDTADLGLDESVPGPWAVLDEAGDLLAVYERHGDGVVKPAVVVAPT